MKKQGIFGYHAIRASDYPKGIMSVPFRQEREFTYVNPRVQVCVIVKKEVVLPPFRVVYPEKYLSL